VILAAGVLAADVIELKPDPYAVVPLPPAPPSHMVVPPSQLPVPVPVFHPSILLDSLEVEIPPLDPLEIDLLESKIERSLAKKRIARAKQEQEKKEPESAKEPIPEEIQADLIQVSGVAPHLLELIPPRPFVDPEAYLGHPEFLPPPEPWGPLGWPGAGWIDFPLDPYGGVKIVKPMPGAKKKKKDDEEEEEPPPVIPEPGTATLLALGLAALAVARRRASKDRDSA
jgi:hypothetical protein